MTRKFCAAVYPRVHKISTLPCRQFFRITISGISHPSRAMATTSRQQPPWRKPSEPASDAKRTNLRIYNSLTREKNPFIPLDPKGETVTWYACGPTVYDDSHLGHARNYVSTDIIRRIMSDYFKFNMKFVMNITDVDDKVRLSRCLDIGTG